jgi:hypothetical protein
VRASVVFVAGVILLTFAFVDFAVPPQVGDDGEMAPTAFDVTGERWM